MPLNNGSPVLWSIQVESQCQDPIDADSDCDDDLGSANDCNVRKQLNKFKKATVRSALGVLMASVIVEGRRTWPKR